MLSYKEYKSVLEEITIKDLADGTQKFRHSVKQYPQAKFMKINKIQPSIGVKTLGFFGEAPSFTRNEAGYNQSIVFKNVEFSEEEPEHDKDDWYYLDSHNVWYKKPGLDENDVQIRCGCLDFRHRISYYLPKNKALFGKIIPYKKKTDRPPLNPEGTNFLCKHLHNFIKALIQKGYIKDN